VIGAASPIRLDSVLLFPASVTGPIVNLATHVIGSLGLAGVAFMTAASGVIGLPGSEPTMLFAGFDVYRHTLSIWGIIVFGVLGDIIGATIAYSIAFWGEKQLIERHGSKIHLSARRLDRTTSWFGRYGSLAVLISRVIPGLRLAFPYAAGLARMPYWRFITFTTLGSIVWITGLGLLGRQVGHNWQSWRNHLEYVDYAFLALIVLAILYLILRRIRTGRGGTGRDAAVDAVSD
jgi:membrane protein DedA with SNARE-associated domain